MATTITANGINFPDGSAGSPSIGGTDTNTGLFTGSDIIGFSTGGSERLRVDSSGNLLFNGNGVVSVQSNSSSLFLGGGSVQPSETYLESGSLTGFKVNGSERMRIDSSGNIGIGTTSPSGLLHISGNTCQMHFTDEDDSSSSRIYMSGSTFAIDADHGDSKANTVLQFRVDDSERMRIDSSGKVAIGNTIPSSFDNYANDLVIGTTAGNHGMTIVGGTASHSSIYFADGTSGGAEKNPGIVDYNHSTNKMRFATAASDAMVIDSSGKVGIGTTSPSRNLTVSDGTNAIISVQNSGQSTEGVFNAPSGGTINLGTTGSHVLTFSINNSEKMRINTSGTLCIGHATPLMSGSILNVQQTNIPLTTMYHDGTNDNYCQVLRHQRANGSTYAGFLVFQNSSGSGVGSIAANGSSTNFNTSSDYRLKENVTAISDGITRLKTLKPSRFNFKVDKDTTVDGFLAHEVTAVPEAVTGTKDQVATADNPGYEIGDPIYQSIDQSKLVPLLTAALQEAVGKIETLETKVAALEAA